MNQSEKEAWYRDRILWRAGQHELLSKRCCPFADLSKRQASIVRNTITEDFDPVLAFWGEDDTWTVLTTQAVYSYYDDELHTSALDEISDKIDIVRPAARSTRLT